MGRPADLDGSGQPWPGPSPPSSSCRWSWWRLEVRGPGAAPANDNTQGVLKYGIDLNNTFSNNFDPGNVTNDCSFTMLANIYQSVAAPGQTAISGGVAQSWTSPTTPRRSPCTSAPTWSSRTANLLRDRRRGQPDPRQDEPTAHSLSAIQIIYDHRPRYPGRPAQPAHRR